MEDERIPERDGFPPGVPAWIELRTPDPKAVAEFYAGLFGWTLTNRLPDGAEAPYLVATIDGRTVAGVAIGGDDDGSAWTTYVAVDDAEAAAGRVRDAGGTIRRQSTDVGDLGRTVLCSDPEGAVFGLWQPGTLRGAQSVNAPNTWNFSLLNSADREGAVRFYSAVFGWRADDVDMGAISGLMLQLPGYADFLEQFDPGIRQRHRDFGAPPGFSDCIGWIQQLEEGDQPHWNVTFSVADADAVAASARGLRGTVLVEPFDVPMVRSAVLQDPRGARFTVSAFNPG